MRSTPLGFLAPARLLGTLFGLALELLGLLDELLLLLLDAKLLLLRLQDALGLFGQLLEPRGPELLDLEEGVGPLALLLGHGEDALFAVEALLRGAGEILQRLRLALARPGSMTREAFPNQARRSFSNSSSVTKSFVSGRSFARIFACVGLDLPGWRARSIAWWWRFSGAENEERPARIALFERGSPRSPRRRSR
jgi:hypothetical protein